MLDSADALPLRPRRVLVAGVSGSGKTTLAARIAGITGGPHTEIDALYHGPDWTPRPTFAAEVAAFTEAPAWTTEWQYSDVRELLADRADLLVWLDLPYWRSTFPRVLRRTVRRSRGRETLWNGNVEPPLWTFFTSRENIIRWSLATRNIYRERIVAVEAARPALVVVRLRTAAEVESWLAGPLTSAVRGGAGG
ncbi:AAA family ATPase [uncultured Leifsonia sp.]|uniref:AAA family ATPase n=1 Tax=uncultured Leifsonia sp. TaxID=340359 RepID=UPI0028D7CC4B|nr:AAA family ATPase [uncultured Leifsonia sp.]